ncbi:triose-phosphate isomerase [Desulfogranum japonicum]|uniref:triose-phosphate isomerase n=1 Tax=Desulfogranum japonicum TaxID=231447 RepID=UPI00042932A4|nr:triose-phosphate isomerase family protein [Desulfogranum japonicum]
MSHYPQKTIVLANWKVHFSPQRAAQWCDEFLAAYRPLEHVEVVLAVPFFYLREIAERLQGIQGVSLAAQTVSPFPQGGYTGATPAAWLQGVVKYVLVGHQERRKYFHESSQDVARQALECLAEGLQPIVCVDQDTLSSQVAPFDYEQQDQLIWAYTPKDAVSLERSHSYGAIEETVRSMQTRVGGQPILYGGGVTSSNCRDLVDIDCIAGVMMGRGCLDATEFLKAFASIL